MRGWLLKLWRRRRMRRDLEAELAFHREMSAAHGNPISLGDTTAIEERAFDLWRFSFVENLWRDLVFATRGLRRSPAFATSALVSLALGIGANTVMFSLAVEFLLSEPSVRDGASLVSVRIHGNSHSPRQVVDFIGDSGAFADVVGDNVESFVNWDDGEETRRLFAVFTTKNYFTALGVPMAHGRGFLWDDPDEVVVLCHGFWRKHFGADPKLVGGSITLEGKRYTVVGVLPANHRTLVGFGFSPDVYLPRYLDSTRLAMYARLEAGTSSAQAQARLGAVASGLDALLPDASRSSARYDVKPLAGLARLRQQRQMQTVSLFFVTLLIVAGLVLLIACVNVTSLMLARASARKREIAMRLALGASRRRLLQQLLVESSLLCAMGTLLGLVLAQAMAILLSRLELPLPLPIQLRLEPDWRLALYAAALAAVATLASGLLPAWQSVKENLSNDLPRDVRMRLRGALVAGQIAVSVVVLTTGLLFLRNLLESSAVNPGFDLSHTLRAEVYLPPSSYRDAQRRSLYVEQSLRALEALPGIEAVAAARIVPFTDSTRMGGRLKFPDNGEETQAGFHWNAVTQDYFRAMGIPILQGRAFTHADRGGHKVVVVNRSFVERHLHGRPPIGCVFMWGPEGGSPHEVVGVVGATKNLTLGEVGEPQLYQFLPQIGNERQRIQFVMRSRTPPATQLDAVRRTLRDQEPGAGTQVATLASSIGLAFLPSQVGAALLSAIGGLGLLLASIGLSGVLAYSIACRTREIAIRIAVGAARRDIVRMVLRDSGRLLCVGSALGLFAAVFVTEPLAMFLVPGLEPRDPATFAAVFLVLFLTGVAASLGPIRRAVTVDPIASLRSE